MFDDTGKLLIGFINLGSVQNCIDDLEQCLSSTDISSIKPEEATHMFVFMVVSLFSDWKMPVAFFPPLRLSHLPCLMCSGSVWKN